LAREEDGMAHRKLWFAALVALTPAAAEAQSASATIYRDTNFSGPAIAIERPQTNLGLRYPVFSIRVQRGSWELCPQPNFRGNCITVDRTTPDLRRSFGWNGTLQSIRPADDWGGGATGGQSLKGMASEFFPAPRRGNARVEACPGASPTSSCAARNADRFCVAAGWAGSARELMETVNRRVYLADVLCVRTGY
jgi:hypothetical protein